MKMSNKIKSLTTNLNVLNDTEAVVRRCSVKKVFLKIPQNSQENNCDRVSFLIKLQDFKRTVLVAASDAIQS